MVDDVGESDSFETFERRVPSTIDDVMGWGKHRAITYLDAARRDPGYMQWAAREITGYRGRLCAEALAVHLGVAE